MLVIFAIRIQLANVDENSSLARNIVPIILNPEFFCCWLFSFAIETGYRIAFFSRRYCAKPLPFSLIVPTWRTNFAIVWRLSFIYRFFFSDILRVVCRHSFFEGLGLCFWGSCTQACSIKSHNKLHFPSVYLLTIYPLQV